MVERLSGGQEAAGSSPAISTRLPTSQGIHIVDTHSKPILLKNNYRFESDTAQCGAVGEIGLRTCLKNKQKSLLDVSSNSYLIFLKNYDIIYT